ncbi:hypothetical protein [Rhodopila sp.]|uniref:hypothetical protein n=1 Tax=Rhodopila sp. TaxID=2480087 RepID=UPI003D13FC84
MSSEVITVRLSQKHAAFLQANLAVLATTTRQAMTRPGVEPDRRVALGSRAALLETIEDAVHGALLEDSQHARKAPPRPDIRQTVQNISRLSAA